MTEIRSSIRAVNSNGASRTSHRLRTSMLVAMLVSAVATGCGEAKPERVPTFPVTGTISFKGQPINGAFVSLHSQGGEAASAPTPRASVGADGSFAVSTYEGQDGAPAGEYVLTVKWYKPVKVSGDFVGGPNVLPRKYERPETSDIKIPIAAQESNVLAPIQLK